jgi:hypothetical protein
MTGSGISKEASQMNTDIVTNQNCIHEKFKNITLAKNLLHFGPELLSLVFYSTVD